MLILYSVIGLFNALFIYVLIKSIRMRYGRYEYSVRKDQEITFDNTLWHELKIKNICNHSYELQGNAGGGSILLGIEVKSKIFGFYLEPYILIKSGKILTRQYFEYGCKGKRVLNLSHVLSEGGADVFTLKGKYLKITSVSEKLNICRYAPDDTSSIMVIAPHPDDAEIAAFGLYSTNTDRSTVITVTAGEGGKAITSGIEDLGKDYHEMVYRTRFVDSIAIPLMAGINKNNVLNFGYFDGTLPIMYEQRNDDRSISSLYVDNLHIEQHQSMNISLNQDKFHGDSTWDGLVGKIKTALDVFKPSIIVAPFPAIDTHSDHEFTTRALFDAIRQKGIRDGKLFLYTNLYPASNFYPFGKKGSTVALPPMIPKRLKIQQVYSLLTDKSVQKKKTVALEMMSDLRANIYELSFTTVIKYLLTMIKQVIYNTDNSYFRRALMNNEIFFVYDISVVYDAEWDNTIFGQHTNC
jgi:LmbE family N-acetylglucosaminyl deacetylase